MREPREKKATAPHGREAGADTKANLPAESLTHAVYMGQLAARIYWLNRHRHWWLRTPEGAAQLEFLERRAA